VNLRARFSRLAGAQRLVALRDALPDRLRTLFGGPPREALDLAVEMNREVRALAKELGVEVREMRQTLSADASDVYIVRCDPQGETWALIALSRPAAARWPSPSR
jgi:hypothetical protein